VSDRRGRYRFVWTNSCEPSPPNIYGDTHLRVCLPPDPSGPPLGWRQIAAAFARTWANNATNDWTCAVYAADSTLVASGVSAVSAWLNDLEYEYELGAALNRAGAAMGIR